uniref:Retroviral polymerase SH3-like domain-containing protein n=1 Tax=Chenopodium quinoa TaxID=63459 RepID=A0A803MVJ0_CHEQI
MEWKKANSKTLGSVCYAHIPSQKRSKLDAKAERRIFIGYDSQAKGYRLFNLSNKKIMISRDAEFDEDASWNWEEEKVEKKFFQVDNEVHDEPRDENIEEAPSTHIQAGNGTGKTSDDDNATGPRVNEKLSRDDGQRKADTRQFMSEPSDVHMGAARRVLSDWGGSNDDMKSTMGYVFSLGSGVFSWISKKHEVVAQSTAEA